MREQGTAMARRTGLIVLALVVLAIAYLAFWPVAIAPVAWQAPPDPGMIGLFAADNGLGSAKRLPLDGASQPVAAVTAPGGDMFIATVGGKILRLDRATASLSTFADTRGIPAGLALGDNRLLVADARRGLLAIGMDGKVEMLADKTPDGAPLGLLTGIAAGPDGTIYLAQAAPRRPADASDALAIAWSTILEHGGDGKVLAFDPRGGAMRVVLDGLHFPAGMVLTRNQNRLLVAEAGSYRVLAIDTAAGHTETPGILVANLPGFPADIDRASDGTFWMGLVAARSGLLDRLSGWPFLRKVVARLPEALRPAPDRHGALVHFDEDGNILETLAAGSGHRYVTGAVEGPENLIFVTSLAGEDIAVLPR